MCMLLLFITVETGEDQCIGIGVIPGDIMTQL